MSDQEIKMAQACAKLSHALKNSLACARYIAQRDPKYTHSGWKLYETRHV